MAEHNQTGAKGEFLAQDFLKEKGYEILATNWQDKKVELDIVAQYQDQMVFVEVKTRSSQNLISPTEAVTLAKQKNLIKAANAYIENHPSALECRFDIVSVILHESNRFSIEHIEDAFYPLL